MDSSVKVYKLKDLLIDNFWLMPSTPKFVEKGVKYITSKNIKNNKIYFDNVKCIEEKEFISISKNRKLQINDFLVTMIGTVGEIARIENEPDFYGQNIYVLRLNTNLVNLDYFLHYFNSKFIQLDLKKSLQLSSQGYLKANHLLDLDINLPSLEKQNKLAEYLNSFETFSAELKAELKARKEQYTYYRNYLLSDEKLNNVYKLSEVTEMKYGTGNKIPKENGEYPVYGSNGIIGYTNIWNNDTGIIIGHNGSAGSVTWVNGKHYVIYSGTICRPKSEIILNKYLYYLLLSLDLPKYYKGVRPILAISDISNIEIKIPSINIQNKIVDVIDNFEKICEDLNIGLPLELNLREQQYAYYRDKLLSFAQGTLEVSPERERERERERLAKCSQINWIHIQATITQNWWI
ncbi:type I restriction-modification system subunit S [Mycoplasmopsis columboralis]|uniref:Type I restriction-modification system subunit S n=1 Tax=Mycoplasmopsis columboralis TaxID=171282 RepID=A0A449B7M1_9BACT|nr:restriction endonuclease subunit S [Mycoplasmopsis columboralis]VEU76582.1 type I restriction-modification system subunit S [Mycoplasmopsis columboralis]